MTVDNLCDYDEAYTREDASEIGFCTNCSNYKCPWNFDKNERTVS